MNPSIRRIPAGGHGQGPASAGPPSDRAEAVAWVRAQLRWERLLADVRRAHNQSVPPSAPVSDGPGAGRTVSRRARARHALAGVLLGAAVAGGVLIVAPPSAGNPASPSPGLTPVARPVSSAAVSGRCAWRPRGWFCAPDSAGTVRVP